MLQNGKKQEKTGGNKRGEGARKEVKVKTAEENQKTEDLKGAVK